MSRSTSANRTTTDNLSERAHESMDWLASTASKGEERIRREAADVEARLRKAGLAARKHSDESLQSISAFVRENPMVVVGIAFAAGALLTALKRRS